MATPLCEHDKPDCSVCASRHRSVFADLEVTDLSDITDAKGCRTYRKGDVVYYAGDMPRGLYCINQGKIKIYKVGESGREQIVRLVKEGDIFGYRALISGGEHDDYAASLDEAKICFIPREVFVNMVSTRPELSLKVLSLLGHELQAAEGRILELAQKPVRERLAEALLVLRETFGVEEDGKTIDVKITREEIASIVGTVTESAIRTMSDLKSEGIIELRRQRIAILDQKRLLEVANIEQ